MIGVDERELDDLALEALAEAYATPPTPGLRQRVLGTARAEAVPTWRADPSPARRVTVTAMATSTTSATARPHPITTVEPPAPPPGSVTGQPLAAP